MIKLLQGPLGAMTLGGIAFLATMVTLLQRPLTATPLEHHEEDVAPGQAFWQGQNLEVDQLLEEVRREKLALTKKEQELRDLAARLEAERAELSVITQKVHQLQVEFDQHVTRVKEEEAPNLKRLAKLYASMTPEGAVAILRELDDQVVVKVFSFMKEAESAPLLDMMAKESDAQAKRAALISEALRRTLNDKKKVS